MKKLISTLLVAATLMVGALNANASTNDFFSLVRVGVSFQEEFRFRDEGNAFFYQYTQFQVKYEINDYVDLFFNYRLIYKENDESWDNANVIMPGVSLKYPAQKWGKVGMSIRGEAGVDISPVPWVLNIHPKYSTPWKWTKLQFTPYVSDEIFFNASDNFSYVANRIRVGIDYKFTKNIKGSTGYYYEVNDVKGTHSNVLNTSITFGF